MAVYMCVVCDTTYDEDIEGRLWEDVPEDWACPVCESGLLHYRLVRDSSTTPSKRAKLEGVVLAPTGEAVRTSELEIHMLDIRRRPRKNHVNAHGP